MRIVKIDFFDLRAGDIVRAPDFESEKSSVRNVRYRVIKVYKHIFLAEKLSGNHRQVGFSKSDYLSGVIKRGRL